MQFAKRIPFSFSSSGCAFIASFLAFPLAAAFHDVGTRSNPEYSGSPSIAAMRVFWLGFALCVLAPWFSFKPVLDRFILSVGLSLGAGLCWFAATGVFLTYYNEWYSHKMHAKEIESAFVDRLLPAAAFVRSFVIREHRLPTDEEMEQAGWRTGTNDWGRDACINLYREPLRGQGAWGVPGKDFLLETAVPEWNLFYRSWDNQRVEANWE